MRTRKIRDQIICLRGDNGEPYWQIFVGGRLVPADFNSKGAALAGIPVERARMLKRLAKRVRAASQ